MNQRQFLGKKGENLACSFLVKNNYNIIEKNFRCKQGEVDIIAMDLSDKDLVFVEVKTRSNFNFGRPSEAVNYSKQKHILDVAQFYIYINQLQNLSIRFDIIEVFIEDFYFKINHIKQAF